MKPSEAVDQGLCPGCLGEKRVYSVTKRKMADCSWCGGTGQLEDVGSQFLTPEDAP